MNARSKQSADLRAANLSVMSLLVQSLVRENIDGWGGRAVWSGDTLELGEFQGRTTPRAALGQFRLLEFPTWRGQLVEDPGELVECLELSGARQRLAEELRHCAGNRAVARRAAQERAQPVKPLIEHYEKRVVEGHPLHPCAKMRWPLSEEQQRQYAPEFGTRLELPLVAVDKALCRETGIGSNRALAEGFPELWERVRAEIEPDQVVVLPLHPYQLEQILPELYRPWLESGQLTPLKGLSLQAAPLMSFRSMEPVPPGKYQLKTAVGVRMTNAVRTVSPQASENGPVLSQFLRELESRDSFSPLHILHEVGGAYFHVGDWDLGRNLSVLYRESPQSLVGEDEAGMPAAALLEEGVSGQPIALELAQELGLEAFLRHYIRVLVPPFLKLLSGYGIALEAHLQNCVVVFSRGRLVRCLYRDFGGVRFHRGRLAQVGLEPQFHPGSATVVDVLDDLQQKLFYPLFQNHLGELFRTLVPHGLDEDWAWGVVRRVCQEAFEALDTPFVEADRRALFGPFWRLKRMAWMRLHDKVTEYTFSPLRNPLFQSECESFQQSLSEPMSEEFRKALPEARRLVGRQLGRALRRENLLQELEEGDPYEQLLQGYRSWPELDWETLFLEIDNALANQALILAHRALRSDSESPWERVKSAPDSLAISETLCLQGHNLHPCARTRTKIEVPYLLQASAELGARPRLRLVSVREELMGYEGVHPNQLARELFPGLEPEQGRIYLPLHSWQAERILPQIYAQELECGDLRLEPQELDGRATAAFRTVIVNDRWMIKSSVGSQMTSTTRCISHQTALNGPRISDLLERVRQQLGSFEILAEPCGVHFRSSLEAKSRNLTCLYRQSLPTLLNPGEVACSGASLSTVLGEILDDFGGTPDQFFEHYAELVVTPHLELFARYGIAMEAHLQNCVITFRDGIPQRLFLRDWGGLRIVAERLKASGLEVKLEPDSLTEASSLESARDKLSYCLFRAHLEEVVERLVALRAQREKLWSSVRVRVERVYPEECGDRDFFLAPTWKLKALTRMRLQPQAGYLYVEHPNPMSSQV